MGPQLQNIWTFISCGEASPPVLITLVMMAVAVAVAVTVTVGFMLEPAAFVLVLVLVASVMANDVAE